MQIDWWTFALQAVNFLVLVWLLRRFLYSPVREVIEKRKQIAGKALAEADEMKSEAEAARRRFEEDRAGLARENQQTLNTLHHELQAERGKLLDEAGREAEELLEAARASIAAEREAALAEVREQVTGMAVELASGLLREGGSGLSSGVFLEQLERRLKQLPAEELERLQKDIAADGARLTVVTAEPLAKKERDQWTDRLSACLGHEDRTEFFDDPEILGGAELRFPHAVLKFTWADQLRKAREFLRTDEAAS